MNHLVLLALVAGGGVLCVLLGRYAFINVAKVLALAVKCAIWCVCQTVKCMQAVSRWLFKGLMSLLRCIIASVITGITIATCTFAYVLALTAAMKISQFIVFSLQSIFKGIAKNFAYALKPMLWCVCQGAKLILKVSLWLLKGLSKLVRMVLVGLEIAVGIAIFAIEKYIFCSRKSKSTASVSARQHAHSVKASEVSVSSYPHADSAEFNEVSASRVVYPLHCFAEDRKEEDRKEDFWSVPCCGDYALEIKSV